MSSNSGGEGSPSFESIQYALSIVVERNFFQVREDFLFGGVTESRVANQQRDDMDLVIIVAHGAHGSRYQIGLDGVA